MKRADQLTLSERDTLTVLDLLENPPQPTARLMRAAKAGYTLADVASERHGSIERPAMTQPLYDRDFYTWTQAQADALRRRSTNEVDWEHLAEEIESLGRSEKRELRSRYQVLLMHLLKWRYQPERRTPSWSTTIELQREELELHLLDNPGLKSLEAEQFGLAYRPARLAAALETGLPRDTFPAAPPFTLVEAKDNAFWPEPPAEGV